jgi:hypothetical protein
MFYWRFHFDNEIPVNCLFTQWKWTYILDFGPWRWSALNMGFVDEWPSRMQGQMVFSKSGGRAAVFGRVQKIWIFWTGGCPCPILTVRKVRRGELNVLRSIPFWRIYKSTVVFYMEGGYRCCSSIRSSLGLLLGNIRSREFLHKWKESVRLV